MNPMFWDTATVESIIAILDEDLDSPAFLEIKKEETTVEYAEGYYNALLQFRDYLQEFMENQVNIAENNLNNGE